ncbi:hypothetical protein Bbelb_223890 [Branchiostoma belcheri]|nr:hypothetical protein Bbelb_223890 [Branchiostoma belcheri]
MPPNPSRTSGLRRSLVPQTVGRPPPLQNPDYGHEQTCMHDYMYRAGPVEAPPPQGIPCLGVSRHLDRDAVTVMPANARKSSPRVQSTLRRSVQPEAARSKSKWRKEWRLALPALYDPCSRRKAWWRLVISPEGANGNASGQADHALPPKECQNAGESLYTKHLQLDCWNVSPAVFYGIWVYFTNRRVITVFRKANRTEEVIASLTGQI